MTKPTTEEAKLDLENIRQELEVMRRIEQDATWLSRREDVDASFYQQMAFKVNHDIANGERTEQLILRGYPELT